MPSLPPPGAGRATVDDTRLPAAVTDAATGHGWLLSVWVPTLLGALCLLLLVGLVVLIRRRKGWLRIVPTALAGLVSLVLCVLAAINSYAAYLPDGASLVALASGDDHVALPTGGDVRASGASLHGGTGTGGWSEQVVHLDDPALDIHHRSVIVALPPGYRGGTETYPVAYLFSGYPGRASDWFTAGRAPQAMDALTSHGLARPCILVAPDVNGGWLHDSETLDQVGGPQVETWVAHDVVGWADTHLRTIPDRADRLLVGMSSGGFAAVNVGLRHQGEFGTLVGLEPYGDPGAVTGRLLGGSLALLHANSPDWYVPTMTMCWRTQVFLDVGDRSPRDVARVRGLADLIAARGQDVDFRVEVGRASSHTWAEASAGFPYAMVFADRTLGSATLDQQLPPSTFPTTRRNSLSTQLSHDAESDLEKKIHRLHRLLHPSPSASA